MSHVIDFIIGYVVLRVDGFQIERFLNLCRNHKIILSKIEYKKEDCLSIQIKVKDFFKLKSLKQKTGVHIHILEKHGLPFFFHKNKKRKAFLIGIFCAFLLLFLFSGRIWNIHIEGNRTRSDKEILNFLKEEGIYHSISKRKIDCSLIAAKIRENYPEITWVSVKLKGVRLLLKIQEGTFVKIKNDSQMSPCNIIANRSGTIVKMITRKGLPLKKVGEYCDVNDVIVSGTIDIKNDNQETIRYEHVHADADIYITYELSYYHEIPLLYKYKKIDNTKSLFFIKWKNHYMELGIPYNKKGLKIKEEIPIFLTENFKLPFSIGKIIYKQYKYMTDYYTEDEVKTISWKKLQNYEEKLIEKGLQISVNNVKIEVNDQICVSKGKLEVVEKIGKMAPINHLEQPIERNTTNGE